jgi:carbon-monoxide dehydrogenase small subunit
MPTLTCIVNGKERTVEIEPGEMLADVLRDKLGLTGTKICCGEGECGACTVLVAEEGGHGVAVDSCIYPASKVQGRRVQTIEGLMENGQLHAIQQAFVDKAAAQCGYCTPGMIMAAKALLDENPQPTRADVERGISGNLCRCTGYVQIVDAVLLAADRTARSAPSEEVTP